MVGAAGGYRHFHDELAVLKQRLLAMSERAESLVELSMEALYERDADKAQAVIDADRDLDKLVREGVRVRVIGGREGLQRDIAKIIENAEARTKQNDKLNLTIAFNYGGQDEIVRAARRFAGDVAAGKLKADDLDHKIFESYLDTEELPAARFGMVEVVPPLLQK